MKRAIKLGMLCALGAFSLAACESIAGIEDRHLSAGDGGTSDVGLASPALCNTYCSALESECNTTDLQVYHTKDACRKACALLPAGDMEAAKPKGNNIACRLFQAQTAETVGEGLDMYCPAAGPGGNNVCGTDCESYCALEKQACPKDFAALDDCEARCKGLVDKKTLSSENDHGGDTLQCRLVHVSNAAVDDTMHCVHARIAHPDMWCYDPIDTPLDCARYCTLNAAECASDDAQYESPAQCQAVCEAFGPEKLGDQTVDPAEDSMRCRFWHSYSAVLDPTTHCSHSGPTGDGHCAEKGNMTPNCPSYCKLMKAGCDDDFKSVFKDDAGCRKACAALPGSKGGSSYHVKTAESDPSGLACRVLHLSRVLAGTESSCDNAVGNGDKCHE